ncbi:hypothetical protein PABG_07327 [Paracoccidioides brasiliensis Pb03]|nr:hypothetical protein PABG_07327 [Paracoccidioides brasiliensis Pb03]
MTLSFAEEMGQNENGYAIKAIINVGLLALEIPGDKSSENSALNRDDDIEFFNRNKSGKHGIRELGLDILHNFLKGKRNFATK